MLLAIFGFLSLSLIDILDIILVALIIFVVFRWIRGTSAMSIFMAILSLYVLRVVVGAFNMRLMSAILGQVLDVGVLALIVIFQPEIRKFLIRFGSRYLMEDTWTSSSIGPNTKRTTDSLNTRRNTIMMRAKPVER